MAKAEIYAGACGYTTTVEAQMNGAACQLTISSGCKAIQKMAAELTEVEPFKEISSRRALPRTLDAGIKYCTHAACPVPVGIIKAVEVAAGLNLPVDASIKVSKE
ncbi:MAG: DUF6951 family protein [Chloroflexota bacterium]